MEVVVYELIVTGVYLCRLGDPTRNSYEEKGLHQLTWL